MYGEMMSETCCKTEVSIGSAADDLLGRRRMEVTTSATEILAKSEKRTLSGRSVNVAGAELVVA